MIINEPGFAVGLDLLRVFLSDDFFDLNSREGCTTVFAMGFVTN